MAVRLDRGAMRHRVQFERNMAARASGGAVGEDWQVDGSPVWAKISPLSSSKQMIALQAGVRVSHEFETSYRPGVSAHSRIILGDRLFTISGVVNPEEANVKLVISAEEVLP